MSHPTWVRGLKQLFDRSLRNMHDVAPYVGAWIETCTPRSKPLLVSSHPTWVRGLKHKHFTAMTTIIGRTLRGCVD